MSTFPTYGRAVAALDADALATLLAARPDLAAPAPSSLRSLGARATGRPSLEVALGGLTTAQLATLETVVALDPGSEPDVGAGLDARDHVGPGLVAELADRMLVWHDDAGLLRPAPGLADVLGPYPAGLGPHAHGSASAVANLDDLLSAAPAGAREILDALTWGPPIGVRPATGPGAEATRWLVERDLLVDAEEHVVLPRAVGLALRGGHVHREVLLAPPAPPETAAPTVDERSVEAESGRAATEAVRWVSTAIDVWSTEPPELLRSGGLGVRELRRVARTLEIDETDAALVLEVALAAGLIAADEDVLAPTTLVEDWLDLETPERWAALVSAWRSSPRTGWLVGTRDARGALRSVLDPDLQRTWVPALRARVLSALHEMPGRRPTPEAVLDVLRWYRPRTVPPDQAVRGILREAALLGVTGAGAFSPAALPLLDDETSPEGLPAPLAQALRAVLPEPVDEVLLQGDLTGIVPGTPTSTLAALLDATSDVESRGSATTVRFSGSSIARALDDRSADELLAALAAHSPVPVPQPLEYLVRDEARRHGSMRVGSASSYVRSDDVGALAALAEDPTLGHLGLRLLAPTVLVASAPGPEVHAALRAAGRSPVVESADGSIVHLAESKRRTRTSVRPAWLPPGRRPRPVRPDPRLNETGDETPAQRAERARRVAARLLARAQAQPDDAAATTPGAEHAVVHTNGGVDVHNGVVAGSQPPGDVVALLHEAIADRAEVDVELIGNRGVPETRRLKPQRLDGGRLRAIDLAREAEITVAVHRVASVRSV
ncbi:helicase-associated domain-containing protein [Paraoerskovia marina]|uniref:helicase-associated domain-containing protein n=1 Tax=Paraoerskovia marina TaxID=545619 RepID=UPI000492DD59|nr:helicase-associated domain-containing protein [Paraoerskovia marina]